MTRTPSSFLRHPHLDKRQRGISLFVVMVTLLITIMVSLAGLRVAGLQETVVGNQADAQRSFSQAEALMNAAQRYVLARGVNCTQNCIFPRNETDFDTLRSTRAGNTCSEGACYPNTPDVFTAAQFAQAKSVASDTLFAGAGKYTEFAQEDDRLQEIAGKSAFWVEVFRYAAPTPAAPAGSPPNPQAIDYSRVSRALPIPDSTYPFIFRITVKAMGLRDGGSNAGTQTLLRAYYVPVELQRPVPAPAN